MHYCVITLDLVNSRHLRDRSEVQEELKEVLCIINDKYKNSLKVPFAFTLGDEVQGVLTQLPESYELIREFQRLLKEYRFYAGVGYGEIVTQISQRSGEMDGPAFHLARAGVDFLKEDYARSGAEDHVRRFAPLVCYVFSDEKVSEMVNSYLNMVELLKYNLTEKQREVYWLLFELTTYSEIADWLQQSKSAITQKVQAGHLVEIRAGEKGFVQLLEWLQRTLS